MNRILAIGVLALLGVGAVVVVALIFSAIQVHNALNVQYETVNGARSTYSAVLNVVPQKIEGVWAMSQQYLDHESSTFKEVAAMRSGLLNGLAAFQELSRSSANPSELAKKGQEVLDLMKGFSRAGGLAVNVQIEQYPQLRAAETTQQAMRTMEEGVNQVETALTDWIYTIRQYNTYRGNAWPSLVCLATGNFSGKFPSKIENYEGEVKSLDVKSLNPQRGQK